MNYETIDTLVATNAARTESVRVSATVGEDGRSAILYTGRDMRITLFDPHQRVASEFNATVASLNGDRDMLDKLEEFTNKYTYENILEIQ